MSAEEAATILAIAVLVAWCFFWIIRHDQQTKRAEGFDRHVETIPTDRVTT